MNTRILFTNVLLCIALFEGAMLAQQSVAAEQKQQPHCLRRLYNATLGRGQMQRQKYLTRLSLLQRFQYPDAEIMAKEMSRIDIERLKKRYVVIHALGFRNPQDVVRRMNDQDVANLQRRYEIISKLRFDAAHDMALRCTDESVEMLKDLCAVGIGNTLAYQLNRQYSLEQQRGILFLKRSNYFTEQDAIDYGITFAGRQQRLLAIKEAASQGDYVVKELLKNILAHDNTLHAAEIHAQGIRKEAETEARNKLAVAQVQAQTFLNAAKHEAEVVRAEVQVFLASVGAKAEKIIGKEAKEVVGKVREVSADMRRDMQKMNAQTAATAKRVAEKAASDQVRNEVAKMKAENDAPPAYVKPDEEKDAAQPPSYKEAMQQK
ncbi:MAG TPA: hypothetical protein VGT41_03735 [Candidatus Babeliales bacterium]|nr:hypothetical protein [Candidatus Babeliales bacterium]